MKENEFEIIIPAYNEEENIAKVIQGIKKTVGTAPRIIVVDDASLDKTAEVARAEGAVVISHPYRIGNGACIKTGLRNALAPIVVFMDGDGQHLPKDILQLMGHIDKFDMVVGARDFSAYSCRNLANKFYSRFASYVTQFKIKDLTSGFRVLRRDTVLKFLYLLPNGFSYPTTITLAFLKTARTIMYVPITSEPRRCGKSKINMIEDGMAFFLIIIRIATFFSPLRVFVPVSILFFLSGLLYYLYTFIVSHRFTNMSVLLLTTSVLIFMLGLVSEQVSQLRMDRTEE